MKHAEFHDPASIAVFKLLAQPSQARRLGPLRSLPRPIVRSAVKLLARAMRGDHRSEASDDIRADPRGVPGRLDLGAYGRAATRGGTSRLRTVARRLRRATAFAAVRDHNRDARDRDRR